MRDFMWIFKIAVPTFLLISAYLYGLKHEKGTVLGKDFIVNRIKSLSIVYYPFVITVFAFYAITDFENIQSYVIALTGSLLYLTNFFKPLPGCGHLWFLQTLMMCYLSLVLCSRFEFVGKCFRNNIIAFLLFIIVVLSGFIYRGADLVFLYFYLFVYYNAKRINKLSSYLLQLICIFLLLIGYTLLALHYEDMFRLAIYLQFIQTCIMAVIIIQLFMIVFRKTSNVPLISWFSTIAMEFYLIHHLFVFDYLIYVSFCVTIFLSFVLHWISKYGQTLSIKLFKKS